MRKRIAVAAGAALLLTFGANVQGQTAAVLQAPGGQATATAQPSGTTAGEQQGAPVALTLKTSIEMALRNSKDIQVAKLQASLATHASQVSKAQFLPNLYA